jgi:type II secretory pathway component PulF
MAVYRYKGYDATGQAVTGEIACATLDDAERRVAAQDVSIVSIAPAKAGKGTTIGEDGEPKARPGGKRISDHEASLILENLAVMAETGVPFIEAIEAVAAGAKTPKIGKALQDMKTEIVGGRSLASAMRSATWLFPPLVSDMVKVAEEGGSLSVSLSAAAAHLERSADMRRRLMNAMLYPIVMASISAITVLVLILFVMPRFAMVFDKIGADIPATTKFMLAAGNAFRDYPMQSAIGSIVTIVAVWLILRTQAAKGLLLKAVRRAPVVGPLLKNLALSRSFQSISTLLAGNVPLVSALEHGAGIAGDERVRSGLMTARQAVEEGTSLSTALSDTGEFPLSLIQLASVGERTGRLGPLMATCAATLERDADTKLKALVSIVEPLMIVVMGATVGTITISIISPIYSVVQNVK